MFLVGGCAATMLDGSASQEQPAPAELGLPRDREGCLPFPGLFTLYAKADPAALGAHHYARNADADEPAETERGIIYSTRGGFLDLAHLRNTVDWTRYCVWHVGDAIKRGESKVAFNGTNGSMVHLDLHYPDNWNAQPPATRERLSKELSLRIGEHVAYLLLVWHETASWFGDRTFVFDESPSAFTWDDVMSHAVGVRIADLALRTSDRPFDVAVTLYLDAMLRALGAVSPEETQIVVDAINGTWWVHGRPLKRQFDVGLTSGHVTPWLVRGLAFTPDAPAQPFTLPDVHNVLDRDYSGFCDVQIEPSCAAADRMRDVTAIRQPWFDADRDLPRIMDAMHAEMVDQFGPQVNVPWPKADQPSRPTHALLSTDRALPR